LTHQETLIYSWYDSSKLPAKTAKSTTPPAEHEMPELPNTNHPTHGVSRKEFLQIGFSTVLGLGLADILGHQQARGMPRSTATGGKAKSVLLMFLTGAPSHQDIWDLKPEAPVGIRGEFQPVDTSVPGVRIGPHTPKLAQMAQRFAIVRSMTHDLIFPGTSRLRTSC
jgi:hypothetical protein